MRIIVPSPPGDGSDLMARALAGPLGTALGTSVVVENKPGAGGVVGSEYAAHAAADGYTLILGNAGSHAINAALYKTLSYDPVRDFAPVGLICTTPNVMVVNPKVPAKTVAEFIAYAKAHPNALNYASGGNGSSAHLSAELFKMMSGVQMTHIPYKGAGPAVAAVIADDAQVFIGNLPPTLAQIKAGTVRALGVTTLTRSPELPDVPPIADTLPGFETVAWFGMFAPAGTPKAVIDRLNAEINKIVASPEMATVLKNLGATAATGTPDAYAARIASDVAKWKKVVAAGNVHVD
ncbi:MAG: tripartite tricarboxylate transporter substrate binding protein [Proteobacteria bacterium]|nr:tripartite tricarboxylate transporter substrate binding protein [Pseudomonadota bacterium]